MNAANESVSPSRASTESLISEPRSAPSPACKNLPPGPRAVPPSTADSTASTSSPVSQRPQICNGHPHGEGFMLDETVNAPGSSGAQADDGRGPASGIFSGRTVFPVAQRASLAELSNLSEKGREEVEQAGRELSWPVHEAGSSLFLSSFLGIPIQHSPCTDNSTSLYRRKNADSHYCRRRDDDAKISQDVQTSLHNSLIQLKIENPDWDPMQEDLDKYYADALAGMYGPIGEQSHANRTLRSFVNQEWVDKLASGLPTTPPEVNSSEEGDGDMKS